ncbi:hypothetical protein F4780DRAFT_285406 [Xylariomycetidae sp. FL0641]|nr:hypothetical protein F4780DRAFT_285406 [Xylariomycetidae sp. FL0641]
MFCLPLPCVGGKAVGVFCFLVLLLTLSFWFVCPHLHRRHRHRDHPSLRYANVGWCLRVCLESPPPCCARRKGPRAGWLETPPMAFCVVSNSPVAWNCLLESGVLRPPAAEGFAADHCSACYVVVHINESPSEVSLLLFAFRDWWWCPVGRTRISPFRRQGSKCGHSLSYVLVLSDSNEPFS